MLWCTQFVIWYVVMCVLLCVGMSVMLYVGMDGTHTPHAYVSMYVMCESTIRTFVLYVCMMLMHD